MINQKKRYLIKPHDEVDQCLLEGYRLHGSPIVADIPEITPKNMVLQALVLKDSIQPIDKKESVQFSYLETACLQGLISGLRLKDIALEQDCSERKMLEIAIQLRKRFECSTNTALISKLYQREIIIDGKINNGG